jgi:nitroreductase
MEGFDPDRMDELLGLKSSGVRSVALLMLGYRNADADYLTGVAKVRKPADLLFIRRDG